MNTNLKGDEFEVDINFNFSRNTEFLNEVILYSFFFLETFVFLIINSMIVYINYILYNDEGSNIKYKEGCSLKENKEGG